MKDNLCPECIEEITEDEVLCVGCNVSYHKACGDKCLLCNSSVVERNALVVRGNTLPGDTLDAIVQEYKKNVFFNPLETAVQVLGDNAPIGLAKIHGDYISKYRAIEQNAKNAIKKYNDPVENYDIVGFVLGGVSGFIGGVVISGVCLVAILRYFGYHHNPTASHLIEILIMLSGAGSGYLGGKYTGKLGEKIGEYVSRGKYPNQDAEKKAIEAKKEEELKQLKEKYVKLLTEK